MQSNAVTTLIFAFGLGVIGSTVSGATSIPDYPEAAPYWLQLDDHVDYRQRIPSGRQLVGKNFLYLPELRDAQPRYDHRILLHFEDGVLHERRVLANNKYQISFEEHEFTIDGLLSMAGRINQELAPIATAFGLQKDVYLAIGDDGDGNLYFLKTVVPKPGYPKYSTLGYLRQLSDEEAEKFSRHLENVERTELELRVRDVMMAGGRPLAYLDSYDYPEGKTIDSIYFGQFDELGVRRFSEHSEANRAANYMISRNRLSLLFRAYHDIYASLYAGDEQARARTGESWVPVQAYRYTADGYGRQVEAPEAVGQLTWVRARFADFYVESQPTTASAFTLIMDNFDYEGKTLSVGDLFRQQALYSLTSRLFLDEYKASSPASVTHFEVNLMSALKEQPPNRIARAEYESPAPLLRLPWEGALSGAREGIAEHGISWERPSEWRKVERGYGVAVYDIGLPAAVQVIVHLNIEPVEDLLPYVNLWLGRDDRPEVASLSQVDIESFQVAGRTTTYLELTRSTQVLIRDGLRTWIFTMYGGRDEVAAHRATFRGFIESLAWKPIDEAEILRMIEEKRLEDERPEEPKPSARSRRRPPGGGG